jgi:hypothetical protein
MKSFHLIILIQLGAFAINCNELEDIHEELMDENALEEISKGGMQASVEEDPNLIDEKTKRKTFFEKSLNDEIKKKKKFRPIVYDGYSLDINIDMFKSTVMNLLN